MKTMMEAKKHFPMEIKTDNIGELSINREKDIIFLVTEEPNLRFIEFNT